MCSPGGSATINSLMKLDTFLFDITVHSHSLTPITLSGTLIFKSPLTLHWHPSLQWSFISFRVKWDFSESSISPPPSRTCTLHCPQDALPPQADERNIPLLFNTDIRLSPCPVVIVLSPFTVIVTLPPGDRYFFAIRSRATKRRVVTRRAPMLNNMNCII